MSDSKSFSVSSKLQSSEAMDELGPNTSDPQDLPAQGPPKL